MTEPTAINSKHCPRCEAASPADRVSCPVCGVDLVAGDEWQAYWDHLADSEEQSLLAELRSVGVLKQLSELQQIVLADTVDEMRDRLRFADWNREDFEYQRLAPAVHKSLNHLLSAIMAARSAVDAVKEAAQGIPEPTTRGLLRFQSAVLANCDEAKRHLGLFELGQAPLPVDERKPRPNEALNHCRKRLVDLFESWNLGTPEAHKRTRRIEIACWPRKAGESHGRAAALDPRIIPSVGADGLVEAYKVAFRREQARANRKV